MMIAPKFGASYPSDLSRNKFFLLLAFVHIYMPVLG
ncbi:hypothetical protein HP15_45 [Marinobacter adhaerens HP15]|uniref:Uncharacterized protein n=1 Tax=Marinobacter adhaerens (strain DSM 23420 / HP15) TaxID=225937 RepID=E4PIA4_MARAH|nr:hypothetical protein HP15_45 [Marinobacter adhaerens HP15]